jgi:hypothetical protein
VIRESFKPGHEHIESELEAFLTVHGERPDEGDEVQNLSQGSTAK